jgi:hypothetical protein
MALTTVGMALEFAGKLEDKLEAVYHQLTDSTNDDQMKENILSLIKATNKRKVGLKRLYDDNVYSDMDTGVLAPIASMQEEDYAKSAPLSSSTDDKYLLECMAMCKNTLERFYRDLSGRLSSGPRPILRRIEKMALEIGEIYRIS